MDVIASIPTVQREVNQQVDQSLRLDPGAAARQFDIDVTRANNSTARGLQSLSEGIMLLAQEREQADITKRVNGFNEDLQRMLYDEDVGILTTTPKDLSNGITEKTQDGIRKLQDVYGKGLSKAAQNRYMAVTNGAALSANQTVMKHETIEMGKFNDEQDAKTISNAVITVVNAPFDMPNRQNALDPVFSSIAMRYRNMPEEYRTKKAEEAMKQINVLSVQRMWKVNPLQARAFLEEHKGEMSEEEYNLLMVQTNDAVVPAEAQAWSDARIEEFGYRNDIAKAYEFIEKNISPEQQDTYKRAYATEINLQQNIYQQEKGSRVNSFIEVLNTGNYGRSKTALVEIKKWLTDNEDAETARNLQSYFDNQFRPKSVAGPSSAQKLRARNWIIGKLREAEEKGKPINTWDDLYMAFNDPEGRWVGELNEVFMSELAPALTVFNKGKSSGGGGSLFSQGPIYTEGTNLLLDRTILDINQREDFMASLEKEAATAGIDMKDDKAKSDFVRKRLLDFKAVLTKKKGFLGFGGGEDIIYLHSDIVAGYAAKTETRPVALGSGGALVFLPATGGAPQAYVPEVAGYTPGVVFSPPTKKTSLQEIRAATKKGETAPTLSDLNKSMESNKKIIKDLTAK